MYILKILEVFAIAGKDFLINEQITDKEVRVVGEDGSQLGIMTSRDAQARAAASNLDLVKIAPQAVPPVCKIMDYGKFRFEQAKKEKEARKNQKVVEIKEIRLSINIDTHDFETKLTHALRFLAEGNKVKVSVRFRGREMAHTSLGEKVLLRFAESCKLSGNVEKAPKLEGRSMSMFISPIQSK
ncbi:Translation initiation factor IF-3 [bioreactor metagenome]|uniref:Translation initiation factor IF-3 n=1 Tax=bioreactor metagenome TaxID=1076179 RepID=A0A644YW87_9ZZZZ